MSPGATRTIAVMPTMSCVDQSRTGMDTRGWNTHLPPAGVDT